MINIAIQIRPLLGGADCAGMVALNHRNNQLKQQGLSNRRIKGMLNLSRQTVDDYVNRS